MMRGSATPAIEISLFGSALVNFARTVAHIATEFHDVEPARVTTLSTSVGGENRMGLEMRTNRKSRKRDPTQKMSTKGKRFSLSIGKNKQFS
jgi:hypothetical protein